MITVQVIEEGTEQYVPVANLLVHESYGNPKSFENDIALWTLRQPAPHQFKLFSYFGNIFNEGNCILHFRFVTDLEIKRLKHIK